MNSDTILKSTLNLDNLSFDDVEQLVQDSGQSIAASNCDFAVADAKGRGHNEAKQMCASANGPLNQRLNLVSDNCYQMCSKIDILKNSDLCDPLCRK